MITQNAASYLRQDLAPDLAAGSAIAEFGDLQIIVSAFARVNPARRGARRLLLTGPVVGSCWAAVLIISRAWTWPVPLAARIALGLALLTVIGLLAAGLSGRRSFSRRGSRIRGPRHRGRPGAFRRCGG